jgi:pimeloyl-ACP methyl ester carboxylesterase
MPYDPADAKPPFAYTQDQTLAFYKSLLAEAPTASVVVIAPSRHFAMLDQPETFYKTTSQFLTSIH